MNKFFIFLFLFFETLSLFGKGISPNIEDQVNWDSFLSQHDLIWERTPNDYFTAPFLGNGLLGAMFYCEDGKKLRLNIGRTDVVEHRKSDARNIINNGRLPIGYFTLEMNEKFADAKGRLELFNAEANFNILTVKNKNIKLKALVLKMFDAIVIEYKLPENLQCAWMFHPEASIVPRNPLVGSNYLNPMPELFKVDEINLCTQKRDAGGSYTTAWHVTEVSKNKFRLCITIQDTYPSNESVQYAIDKIKQLLQKGEIDKQIQVHRKWWNDFFKKSFISVPHAKMESVYWIQQYKFGSMMRKNGPLCDLMGPWYKETSWPGIWWNLNTQMLYSSLHISNQLELASTLPDYIIKMNDALIASVPPKWQYNSAGVSRCTGPNMQESILTWPSPESPERSNLTYLCYYLWEYYRVSMDNEYLRNNLYPLLRRSVNLMLHEIITDRNGVIHTPLGHCPESSDEIDNNYDLSSLMWGCQTLLKMSKKLKINDPLVKRWQEVINNLLPFPIDENGYRSSVSKPAPHMHRHWCHLFQIYPYYLVNWEQPENRDNIQKSLKYWGSPEIPNTWTQCVISSMYSSIRDGEKALQHMNLALESPNFYPNTFHAEGRNPCSETYGGLCRMLQDMLIQSWGERIRIFPAVPNDWKDVVFHNLRAEGGFEVSARLQNGKVIWVKIKNNFDENCIIEPGFTGDFKVFGGKIKKESEGVFSLYFEKEKEILLYDGSVNDFIITPVICETKDYNYYGLKSNVN